MTTKTMAGLAVVVLLSLGAAEVAEAQFGGLRRIRDRAAGAVAGAVVGNQGGERGGPPAFNDEVLEITPEVAGRWMEHARASLALDSLDEREQAGRATQERRLAEYDACQATVEGEMQAFLMSVQPKMLEAQRQGNVARIQALSDSVLQMQTQGMALMAQRCGAEPGQGPDGIDAQRRAIDLRRRATALTERQYSVMLERIAAFLEARRRAPGGEPAGFSAVELETLTAREQELAVLWRALEG